MISSAYVPDKYSGDNSHNTYTFSFRILQKADLLVITVTSGTPTTLTLDTDYTIANTYVDNPTGGQIVLTGGNLATGTDIYLLRETALTQITSWAEGEAFPTDTIEEALDKLTMIAQEHDNALHRAIKFAITSASKDKDMPEPGTDGQLIEWLSSIIANTSGTKIILTTLPTTDPHVSGQLWNNVGVLTVSAG